MHATAPALLDLALGDKVTQLLLVIDIARLRDVNGLHGFGFGDELLRQFARRLTHATASRLDGGADGRRPLRAAGAEPGRCRRRQPQSRLCRHRCPRPPVPSSPAARSVVRGACRGGAVSRSRQRLRSADARGGAGAGELPVATGMAAGACSIRSSIVPRSPASPWRRSCEARRRARRAGAALSAAGRPRRRQGAGGRGAAALAAPRAGPGAAAELHPDRRGQRPDPADRRLGAGRGLPCRPALARSGHRGRHLGQRVGGPAQAPGPAGDGEPGPCGHRPPRASRSSSS